ncbi:hypothetical protein [Anaeromyxobacter paludicola]|uniref:Response regulatory domain-containing protein n=1 Tax=Anaeromyxobacter paludicola TaxID=2918171 RepID=A0ABM7XEA7_9BACT|nr:hypothetical protein [Anaeromyxobacter paludicola]BDG10195.1 hypothetical protein AMPC_33080 [Anaeromyxobacter paludicola]
MPDDDASELVLVVGPDDAALAKALREVGGFSDVRFCPTAASALQSLAAERPMLVLVGPAPAAPPTAIVERLRCDAGFSDVPVLRVEDVLPLLEPRAAAR